MAVPQALPVDCALPVVLVQLFVGRQGLGIDDRNATGTADRGVQREGTAWQQGQQVLKSLNAPGGSSKEKAAML
jgi:hypothetical protein